MGETRSEARDVAAVLNRSSEARMPLVSSLSGKLQARLVSSYRDQVSYPLLSRHWVTGRGSQTYKGVVDGLER